MNKVKIKPEKVRDLDLGTKIELNGNSYTLLGCETVFDFSFGPDLTLNLTLKDSNGIILKTDKISGHKLDILELYKIKDGSVEE